MLAPTFFCLFFLELPIELNIASNKPKVRKAPGAKTSKGTLKEFPKIFIPNILPFPINSLTVPIKNKEPVKPKPLPSASNIESITPFF